MVLEEDRQAIAEGRFGPVETAATHWRRAWLEGPVRSALARGDAVTDPVPFKCAHQPHTGNGVLEPAPVHFSGAIVCLTMPFGGSHIDQVVAQMSDNGMCHHIGMPLGGYSKTYVHEETLRLATSGRGLRLVAAVSDDWGMRMRTDGLGKIVWFTVPTGLAGATHRAAPLRPAPVPADT
jgi:hypothetical protein